MRGGSGEGVLGWHRRAISAYTWCVTEKGPQRKWLQIVGKADTPGCHCHREEEEEQSGRHTVEECRELTEARKEVGKEMAEWWTRHSRDKKKEKGDVGTVEREKEEGEKLESFFGAIYEFFNPVPVIPVVPVNDFVLVVLPASIVPVVFVSASSPNHCITTR